MSARWGFWLDAQFSLGLLISNPRQLFKAFWGTSREINYKSTRLESKSWTPRGRSTSRPALQPKRKCDRIQMFPEHPQPCRSLRAELPGIRVWRGSYTFFLHRLQSPRMCLIFLLLRSIPKSRSRLFGGCSWNSEGCAPSVTSSGIGGPRTQMGRAWADGGYAELPSKPGAAAHFPEFQAPPEQPNP